ncbi:alanine--tRNA ligase [Hazenella sp. IB182353]|uniref:alanine--tRNA ligase n=1 Tax=Polycladospora coralii TaxID=2771432 RepID=UPI001746308C|nr:alanine--tRNA ligase [Polycladospora coralii]MBS7530012.1 alanine--tRNA ligase [Polycladospora coralii]
MKSADIRNKYLDFFKEKGHKVEPSASLVPVDDPSLLWVNSGVATLKKYFDGRETPANPRIVNAQKSIRTNDIENVGYTARHQTFFEMLGNFSIGDYFKEEAIIWAWEFLTSKKWLGLEEDKLYVTVHPEDEEAFQLWHEKIGLDKNRIVKLEENFWDIGEGPSGPNTEIFYDRGPEFGDISDPECYPGGENERYLEIWNLVFSQFNHNPDGSYTPLPKKNIDTGMGFERITSILQNTPTNYETDLFMPIILETCKKTGKSYGKDPEVDIALKVIADHTRTLVFAIGDGVLPSNEGRGYVLRRLLRRAVRYGRTLGIQEPFLYTLTDHIAEMMKSYYPEPASNKDFIARVIQGEEERFLETLSEGLRILEEVVDKAKSKNEERIAGKDAFQLYDTYGFPVDLTEDFAKEHGLDVDRDGFDLEMKLQRERARIARKDMGSMQVQGGALTELKEASEFVGYRDLSVETKITSIIFEDQFVDILGTGKSGYVLLEKTPFYAESGGQVADRGTIMTNDTKLVVQDVQKGPHGQHVMKIMVEYGTIRHGDKVLAQVDHAHRGNTVQNHTATHLLHKALKEVLGDHVNQAGSLVGPDRLRFDFSHIGAMTEDEIRQVESRVNEQIWANNKVEIFIKSLDDAKMMGAMALFGEKYGEVVRVVKAGAYSIELCGGTHVQSTGEIGLFKIISESGIGSGTRRIEAATGERAFLHLEQLANEFNKIAEKLKVKPAEALNKVDQIQSQIRQLSRENESLRNKLNQFEAGDLQSKVEDVAGIQVLAAQVEVKDMNQLRKMVDDLKLKQEDGIIVLGASVNGKAQIVASVSKKQVENGLHAGKLVKEIAERCDGGGGGRPDMAQAGGKSPEKLQSALQYVKEWVTHELK